MKHILYPIPVLLLMVCSLVFCQCSSRRGPYDPQLMHIDSLLNEADVDTAKVLAAFGRVSKSLDTENRMYYNLLTQYYMFKTYQPVENDSILRAVIEYYGDKPTKEGLLANYIATGMYNDRNEFAKAQDCGLRFLRMSDRTSKFDKVMRAKCHLQLGDIYQNHLDSLMVLEQRRQAVYWAEQTTDTMLMADSYYYLSNMCEAVGDYKQSLSACDKAYEYYSVVGYRNGAARIWVQRAKNYMALNDLPYAKLCMRNYEAMTTDLDSSHRIKPGLNNEIYYNVMGRLCEKSGDIDSAFMYYNLEFASPNEVFIRFASGHLARLYEKIGKLDSAGKYYQINMQYQKKSTSTYSDKNMQRKQIEYDLGVLNEKRISKEHMLVAISVVALLLVTLAFKKWPWIKKTVFSLRNRSNGELADNTKDVKADEIENHENSEVSNEKPFSLERREGQLEETASTVSTKNGNEELDKLLPHESNDNPFIALRGAYGSPVDYSSFPVVGKLRAMVENDEDVALKETSWRELEAYVKKEDAAFAAFMVCLKKNCKRITSVHIRVCILLRVGLLPTGISKLMNVSQSAVTNLRRNLAVKILRNPQSKAEDLDVYIRSL